MTERKFSEAIPVKELLPYINESIKDDGTFTFYPGGQSMRPTIVGKQDCVVLKSPQSLKKGDIVLYRRNGEKFVLHRIIGEKDGKYIMCGDNQFRREFEIEKEAVIAVVDEIRKGNGKVLTRGEISNPKVLAILFFKRQYLHIRSLMSRVYYALFKRRKGKG